MTTPTTKREMLKILKRREAEWRKELNEHLRHSAHVIWMGTGPEPLCRECLTIEGAIAAVLRLQKDIE